MKTILVHKKRELVAHAHGKDNLFTIFPSEYLGLKAKERLLFFTGSYKNLSLFKAIHRYAPSVENNTSRYYRSVKNAVGVDKLKAPNFGAFVI